MRDPKFRGSEFFDPHDAVQVKYEMLRRVSIDKLSVTEASDEYGVSRPTYYQAKVNFNMAGIAGLVPTKPGPRRSPPRSTTRSWHFCRRISPQANPSAPGNLPTAPPGTRYRASSQIDRAGSKKSGR
ncbi:helix-turn-helix domain-containing protein [Rhizobium beringeri]